MWGINRATYLEGLIIKYIHKYSIKNIKNQNYNDDIINIKNALIPGIKFPVGRMIRHLKQ